MPIYVYGLLLTAVISILSLLLSKFIPLGSVTIAILLGIIVGNTIKFGEKFNLGISIAEKQFLAIAIALMGVDLNFKILAQFGVQTLVLIIVSMIFTIATALFFAKLFKLDSRLGLLLGIGNAVCGSSAIAASQEFVAPEKKHIGMSITVVNFLGTIGIFILPLLANILFQMDDLKSGIAIGNTLQAVGHVTASGFSVSEAAGTTATVIKMGRILMLSPLLIILFIYSRTKNNNCTFSVKKIAKGLPLFIIGFIFFSLIQSFGLINAEWTGVISDVSSYFLLVAMAAIGLRISFKGIINEGKNAIIVGTLVFIVQIAFTLTAIMLLF